MGEREWRENLNEGDEVIVGGMVSGEFVRWHDDDEHADVRMGSALVVVWWDDLSAPVSA